MSRDGKSSRHSYEKDRDRYPDRDKERDKEKNHRAPAEDDSTDSETDYRDSTPFIDFAGISEKVVIKSWREQRGICRITGTPMSGKTGLYSPVATLRVFTRPPAEGNVIVVCRVINEMRTATNLPWRQFAQLVKIFGDQIGSGFQF